VFNELTRQELEAHEPIYPFVQVDLNPKQRIEASAVQPNAGLKYCLNLNESSNGRKKEMLSRRKSLRLMAETWSE